jgi:hypothetical protein
VRVAAALLAALALAGCGGGDGTAAPVAGRSAAPCTSLPPADPAASLPEGFPAPEGQVLYGPASAGATRIVFGRVEGESFVALRDRLAADLQAAGYSLDGTDRRPSRRRRTSRRRARAACASSSCAPGCSRCATGLSG